MCCQISIVKTVELLKLDSNIDVSKKTVALVFQRLRDVCSRAIRDDRRKLGGRETVVEMDESLVFKIKYNRGSGLKQKQIWVFGMVERKDFGLCHIQIVKNRKAETLLAIIYDHVRESSLIHSDSWSSYNKITEFLDLEHQTSLSGEKFSYSSIFFVFKL